MTGQTASRRTAATNRIPARAPLIMALEPRLMFDGAAVADAVQHADAAEPAAPPAAAKEVAFVDKSVSGWESLANGVRDGVEVVYIEAGQSGLEVMAQWAQSHSGYDAIHVLSHGADSTLFLGTDTVTSATLADSSVAAKLAALGSALAADGDLMLYGCSVAADTGGQAFLDTIATITGADVAASDDATGATALGGDWVLEKTSGMVESETAVQTDGYDHLLALTDWQPGTYDFNSGFASGAKGSGGVWDASTESSTYKATFRITGTGGSPAISIGATPYIQLSPGGATSPSASFESNDGNEFKLTSLTWRNTTGTSSATVTFTAYRDGVEVGTVTDTYNNDNAFRTINFDSTFQNIDKIVITGLHTNGIRLDDIVIATAVLPPTVVTPTSISYTDTANDDSFSNTTGTLSATADTGKTVTGYGIGGPGTGAGDTINGVTYDVSKAGTYGTLYVKSTGEYVYVPNATAVNAVSANQSETFTVTATDNTGDIGNATLTVNITGANDTPTLAAPTAASYTDTSAADTFTNTTGTLSGADRDTGASQTYGISGGTTGGSTDIGGIVYDVSMAGTYGTFYVKSSTGQYVFVPNATAINGVSANQSETFTVSVSDGSLSATRTYTVNVTGANDNPVLSTPSTIAYTDTSAADTFTNTTGTLSATDADGTIAGYGISGGTTGGSTDIGGTVYDVSMAGTYGTLYVKSTTGAYVYVPNATAINGVTANQSETFTVTATDNGSASNNATLTVNVTGANDAPTVTTPGAVTLTDTAANDTFSNTTGTLSASDSDGTVASYGISGGTTGGSTDIGGIVYDVSMAGTYGTLYVKSTTGQYVFVPNATAANAVSANQSETFTVTATDNGGTSGNANLTVNVTGANDTPTLAAPTAASYTDTSAADTFTNTTGTLSGADRDTGASQTYGISGGTTGGSTDIGGIVYDVSMAGTYGTFYVKSSTGQYVYVPNATAINGVTANQSETFTVSVSDGSLSATQTYTVNVTGANDIPVVANLTGDSVNYSVGGNAVALDASGNATVTDADNANFNGGNVTVSITANGVAGEDVLGIANQGTGAGQIGVSGANITYGGTTIGSFTGGSSGADLVISLNANATPAAVQALVRALTYSDTDASTSNTATRTIRVTVNDGAGTSANHDVTVSLVAAPIIDLDGNDSSGATNGGYFASFTENGGAVAIVDSDATLADDGANLNQLVITLTNPQTGDVLTLAGRNNGDVVNGITITYTSASVITLSGTASKADYLALMKEARFNNTSEAPNTTARTITVAARDTDNNTGSSVSATVSVSAVNDAPALSGNLTLSAVNEDTTSPAGATIASLASGIYSDPDNGSETINGLAIIGNAANASTEGAWQYSTDGGTTWHAVGTVTDGATALALSSTTRLRFVPVANYNGTPPALSVRALDASYSAGWTSGATRVTVNTTSTGGSTAIAATARDVTTSITAVNDSPVVTLTSGSTTYSAGVAVDATLTLADVDSTNLTQAVVTITNLGDGASESLALSTAAQTAATTYGLTVGAYNTGTGTLTITGNATKAQYQEVLRGITYTNSAVTKTGTSRTVSFVVRDSSGDGGTQDSATVNKTVTYNTAPSTSGDALATTGTAGTALSYALPAGTFTDPGDTLTYSASGLPAGVAINTTTGTLSGTPTTAGTYTVTITATDGSGATATKTVSVTIATAPSNTAPVTPTAPEAINTTPAAPPGDGNGNDSNAPAVTVVRDPTVPDKPADMQTVVRNTPLPGNGSGADGGGIGGTLGGGQGSGGLGGGGLGGGGLGGGFGGLTTGGSGTSFQISVAPRPPGGGDALVVNAPMRDTAVPEGSRISVTVPATAFAHTSSGATVTLSATRSNGASLPGWMNFNPRTGTFEGTPPPGFRGEVVVRVIARDNQGREAVQTFKIVVGQGGGTAAPQGGGDGQGQGQGQPGGAPGQTGEAPHQNDGKLAQVKPMGRPSLTEQLREQSQQTSQAKLAALFGTQQSNVA